MNRTSTLPRMGAEGLIVDGRPTLVIGGEVHNSSTRTREATDHAFRRARELGADTVLAPVTWELLEPSPGVFDFSQIDGMLEAAHREAVRLIPLWFGSWKNATSSYVPGWVKSDPAQFPRAHTLTGPVEHVSPFSGAAREADAAAFAELMAHIRESDHGGRVVMVQIENEVGLLGDSRDRSPVAEGAWALTVPQALLDALASSPDIPAARSWTAAGRRSAGTWAEIFGGSVEGDEAFMAWGFSTYIEAVASAGAAEHPVPYFVNAWLNTEVEIESPAGQPIALAGGAEPGGYPSGGPVARVAPIWAVGAPTIALLAPDIYFGDFAATCAAFFEASGMLFIPEMRRSELGVAQMLVAVGEFRAAGVSPFGVDSLEHGSPGESALVDGYRQVRALADLLVGHPERPSRAAIVDHAAPPSMMEFGDLTLTVAPSSLPGTGAGSVGYVAVVEEEPGRFVAIGRGVSIIPSHRDGRQVGILAVTELDFDGDWQTCGRLNGDETASGTAVRIPPRVAGSPDLFPIPLIMTSTGMLRAEFYDY